MIGSLLLLGLAAACTQTNRTTSTTAARTQELREVTVPDLSRVDPSVQEQVRQSYAQLTATLARPGASDAERGAAYGRVGVLLHASEYHEAAEPAYLNAQALMPNEPRWPYYLAHLYKSRGDPAKSMASFARALELKPDEVAALVWLGRGYLDRGEPEKAQPLFERAQQLAPQTVAVLVGLGQTALARRDFARAASVLEQALAIDPASASVHSPLTMAYRGLGDTARAESHLKQWRNTEVLVPDPMRLELDLALESGLSYELRGVRALEARDFKAAEGFFRKGVEVTPGTTALGRSLRHKLGTALVLSGDTPGAVKMFEETIRLAPATGVDESTAKAHYSLGLVRATEGNGREALAHLSAAVRYSPTYVEAILALGDMLRLSGQDQAALVQYEEALRINPKAADARFGYAMALAGVRRYREARDWLAEASRLHPDRPAFGYALARLLAAAPDPAVRDGSRAMAMAQELSKGAQTMELGETLAMAHAELGQFKEAAEIQRSVIGAAERAGNTASAKRMTANLRRYERGEPCRTPWTHDDPFFANGGRL